jgi:hypothetical protein
MLQSLGVLIVELENAKSGLRQFFETRNCVDRNAEREHRERRKDRKGHKTATVGSSICRAGLPRENQAALIAFPQR